MKQTDFFRKFGLKQEPRERRRLLWVDEFMLYDTPFARRIKAGLRERKGIPEGVEVKYVSYTDAMRELTDDCFLVVINEGDIETKEGLSVLKEIAKSGRDVAVVYTLIHIGGMVRERTPAYYVPAACPDAVAMKYDDVPHRLPYIIKGCLEK